MKALKLSFAGLEGEDQLIELHLYADRITAACNGETAVFPVKRAPAALAAEIYDLVYTGDNKYHRANITNEIADWLSNGDGGEGRTAAELAKEWNEYDQEPEKETDEPKHASWWEFEK